MRWPEGLATAASLREKQRAKKLAAGRGIASPVVLQQDVGEYPLAARPRSPDPRQPPSATPTPRDRRPCRSSLLRPSHGSNACLYARLFSSPRSISYPSFVRRPGLDTGTDAGAETGAETRAHHGPRRITVPVVLLQAGDGFGDHGAGRTGVECICWQRLGRGVSHRARHDLCGTARNRLV